MVESSFRQARFGGRMACECGSLAQSQPRTGAAASMHVWSAVSGGQEMPTVSAVSLTVNEFPGGGDGVCVFVSGC